MAILKIRHDLLQQFLEESVIQYLVALTDVTAPKVDFFYPFNCEHCSYGTDKKSQLKMHSLVHLRKEMPQSQFSFTANTQSSQLDVETASPETQIDTYISEIDIINEIPQTGVNTYAPDNEFKVYLIETEVSAEVPDAVSNNDVSEAEVNADVPVTEDSPNVPVKANLPDMDIRPDVPNCEVSAELLETQVNENIKDMQCELCSQIFQVPVEHESILFQGNKCTSCCGDFELLITQLRETTISCEEESPSLPSEIIQEGVHQCDICHKCFKSPASVKKHRLVHFKTSKTVRFPTDVTPSANVHQCDICHKTYKTSQSLKKHSQVHLKENTNEILSSQVSLGCETSIYFATSTAPPSQHKPANSADKTYKCDFCNKNYASKGSLTRHVKVMH